MTRPDGVRVTGNTHPVRRSLRQARRRSAWLPAQLRALGAPILAGGGVLVLGLLGIWAFVRLGAAPPSILPTDAAPQAPASGSAPASELPVLGPGVAIAPPQAGSPFDAITQSAPKPVRRTGLTYYQVRSGDVIWQVAEQFQLRPETILWANDLDNPDLILVGQTLTIPPDDGVMYTVRDGDQLSDVASRYGVDANAILSSNALLDPNQLPVGQDIFLPGGRPLQPSDSPAAAADTAPDTSVDSAAPLPDNVDDLLNAGWLVVQSDTNLYRTATGDATVDGLPSGVRLERLDGLENGRLEVRDAGDGRTREAMTGWVIANQVGVGRAPSSRELPLSYPEDASMDITQVFAPYRSQLDGSPYAAANCGPTAIGMALAAFGVDAPPSELRAETLNNQHMWGNGTGTLITALADTIQQHGLQAIQLKDDDGSIHRWSVDEVRDQVNQRHPVIVQTRYRNLPGRGGAYYFGDHYIVITGVVPGGFLYNDPIEDSGVGWDRVLSDDALTSAMDAADRRYVQSAFAVSE